MKNKINKQIVIVIAIALLLVGVITILTSKSNGSLTGFAVTNPIKICNEVQVPYNEQEVYEVQEPYEAVEEYQVPLKYGVVSATDGSTTSGFNYLKTLTVEVRNVDTETGLFTVQMFFKTLNDGESLKEAKGYIMPGEIKSFYQTYDSDFGEDVGGRYQIIPGKKTLTRTVTKYMTVTKYKTVTKYRTEEKCT